MDPKVKVKEGLKMWLVPQQLATLGINYQVAIQDRLYLINGMDNGLEDGMD